MKKTIKNIICKIFKINDCEDEIAHLKKELAMSNEKLCVANGEIQKLKQRPYQKTVPMQKVKNALIQAKKLDFSKMSGKEQYDCGCRFPITQDKESGKWCVSMNICSLGGCEFNDVEFDTQQDACEYAFVLTQIGAEPDIHSACPSCYHEYMQEAM